MTTLRSSDVAAAERQSRRMTTSPLQIFDTSADVLARVLFEEKVHGAAKAVAEATYFDWMPTNYA